MKELFTNVYPIQKTLRFSLIPVGKTEENFNAGQFLESDRRRAEDYVKVKGYIDRYHRVFIESVLSNIILDGVQEYASLYYKLNKTAEELKEMETMEQKMRTAIAKAFSDAKDFKKITDKDMIKTILPTYLTEKEEKDIALKFNEFTTYFKGFNDNRKNMYTAEAQPTAISYRCINENLPKFLDNAASFKKVRESLPKETLDELNETFFDLFGITVDNIFEVDYFSRVLSQGDIDRYNAIVGEYNKHINLYNQQVAKIDKKLRLPLMKVLFKQILIDKETVSFIPEKFENDNEVLKAVYEAYNGFEDSKGIKGLLEDAETLFADFASFNPDGIFISAKGSNITDISNSVFGSWSIISEAWGAAYSEQKPFKKGKDIEKYNKEKSDAFKKIKSFSISELQSFGENAEDKKYSSIAEYFTLGVSKRAKAVREYYLAAEELLGNPYNGSKKLCTNEKATELLKNLLDSIKAFEWVIKPLTGSGKEENKDEVFYGEFLPLLEGLFAFDKLYDKVRNYMTQKPYSTEKIKLNFENPQFLGGWPYTKETDYSSFMLRKDGKYYLAIMNPQAKKKFKSIPRTSNGEDSFEKMFYYQAADPSKDIPNLLVIDGKTVKKNGRRDDNGENRLLEQLRNDYLPENINRIRLNRSFSKTSGCFSEKDLADYIAYYQERVAEYYSNLRFSFKAPSDYSSFPEFTDHVNAQAYQVWFEDVSLAFIMESVDEGSLFLFRIYNKDFSEFSKGKPNLHTLYFKMLFDERNLSDVVFKLNGEAEMFYRDASIADSEKITHPANQPLENKNPQNPKHSSKFGFELVKDRRFTRRSFSLHVPITINFKATGASVINNEVRRAVRNAEDIHIIGIDRGERNLLYVSVIDSCGRIVEQASFNVIESDNGYRVDYHELLDRREEERDKARKNWTSVENIKELKEGYLSQVVHKICELVVKYDAVIAMENLNFGFKRGRFKVEKQVYQKFENMLISKLNFLASKDGDPAAPGGLLRAYQLTNKVEGVSRGNQNGIIFYVPAWDTSKIDPVTGFVNLLRPKYTSRDDAIAFFKKFKGVRYNSGEDFFEFDFDYSDFDGGVTSFRKEWTLCTFGDRIRTFRNPAKNNEWDNEVVNLTEAFKKHFEKYEIDISANILEQIVSQADHDFFRGLVSLLTLTLQLRNSETGNLEVDYIISPVRDSEGNFYDSRNYSGANAVLPVDADANGAYNIARKALWTVKKLKAADESELDKVKPITNREWLEFAQEGK